MARCTRSLVGGFRARAGQVRHTVARLGAPLLLVACGASVGACSTYRKDLDRAREHYDHIQYEDALALFRVLEPDLDSLSPADRVLYNYSRGINDYRLSGRMKAAQGFDDTRRAYREEARHWLSCASASEKQVPGALNDKQHGRMLVALKDLNHDIYGGPGVYMEGTDEEDADLAALAMDATPTAPPPEPPRAARPKPPPPKPAPAPAKPPPAPAPEGTPPPDPAFLTP